MRPMTPKEERFIAEYLVDLNGSAAAVRAGYTPRNARTTAQEILARPHIAEAIEKAKAKRLNRIEMTQDQVIEELSLLAFSDVTHYVIDDSGNVQLTASAPTGAQRALQSVKRRTIVSGSGENARTVHEVEIKLWDKIAPLMRAGRHLDVHGFSDRIEHTGKDGEPLNPVTVYEIPSNGREKGA